jgi:hypothetical protein
MMGKFVAGVTPNVICIPVILSSLASLFLARGLLSDPLSQSLCARCDCVEFCFFQKPLHEFRNESS